MSAGPRALLLRVALAFLLVAAALGVSSCMDKRQAMLKYVSDKYGEEFVVESYRSGSSITKQTLGGDEMLVHAKDAGDEPFLVWESGRSDPSLLDDRVQARWSKELRDQYGPLAKRTFGDEAVLNAQIGFSGDYALTKQDLSTPVASYVASHPDAHAQFLIVVPADGEPDPARYAERLVTFSEATKALGAQRTTVALGFGHRGIDYAQALRTAGIQRRFKSWGQLGQPLFGHMALDPLAGATTVESVTSTYVKGQ